MATKGASRGRSTSGIGGEIRSRSRGGDGALLDELSVFESNQFVADEYVTAKCNQMSEKDIRRLCKELADLRRGSAEEMRKSVYSNYSAFIRTSREISDLESELLTMRSHLASQGALLHSLLQLDGLHSPAAHPQSGKDGGLTTPHEPTDLETRALVLPDILDVLLAERKVDEALGALEEGDKLAGELRAASGNESWSASDALTAALSERRAALSEQLSEVAQQLSVRGAELRAAISALARLDGPRAHTLLLTAHHQRLQAATRALHPSGTSYGGALTAALSQRVFSTIARAASDSAAVFGDRPAFSSELVLWAHAQTEACAVLLKRHVLSSAAAAGGLRAAAECVTIALGHCSLLEEQGLSLSPALSKLLRPSVEQALAANLKRIEESVAALSAADDWLLTAPPPSSRVSRSGAPPSSSSSMKMTSSAHRLYNMVQEFLDDVVPLVMTSGMQLAGPTLEGLARLVEAYLEQLKSALPSPLEEEDPDVAPAITRVGTAGDLTQQLALLGNAAALADDLFPRALQALAQRGVGRDLNNAVGLQVGASVGGRGRRPSHDTRGGPGPRSRLPEHQALRRRLQRGVESLRDKFCWQLAAGLMYGEEDDSKLVPDRYLDLDQQVEQQEWEQNPQPSSAFQAIFEELMAVAGKAASVLAGRERVVTLLMMRLTESLVHAVGTDSDFWEGLEGGRGRGLGAVGLSQFVLDINFLMQVAISGRYSSRTMTNVATESIARAIAAFSAHTGVDPNSVLPEDAWFQARAQDALTRLVNNYAGEGRGMLDGEPNSPTHSIASDSSYQSQESKTNPSTMLKG